MSDPADDPPEYLGGMVLEAGGDQIVAEFRTTDLMVEVGDVLLVFFRAGRRFVRQSWEVLAVNRDADKVRLRMQADDRMHSADNRRSERFSTVFEGMTAKFGDESDCLVLDVSEDGLAVVAAASHDIGGIVRLEMWVGETFYAGTCVVRTAVAGQRGRTRYGLETNPDEVDDNLQHSLRRLWLTLQVRQLENSLPVFP